MALTLALALALLRLVFSSSRLRLACCLACSLPALCLLFSLVCACVYSGLESFAPAGYRLFPSFKLRGCRSRLCVAAVCRRLSQNSSAVQVQPVQVQPLKVQPVQIHPGQSTQANPSPASDGIGKGTGELTMGASGYGTVSVRLESNISVTGIRQLLRVQKRRMPGLAAGIRELAGDWRGKREEGRVPLAPVG